ncbi:MAG: hypothetical protein GY847_35355 [Proteobacteria bacterium]|nr:hypothetical protein [Pseudomonadota bacterium]
MRILCCLLNVTLVVAFVPSAAFSFTVLPSPKSDEAEPVEAEPVEAEPKTELDIGGALRFVYAYRGWEGQEGNQNRIGDFSYSMFRINVDGAYGDLKLVMAYRFYMSYHMLEKGWIGYDFTNIFSASLGVFHAPFGILPYASHAWFFGLPHYVGLEADSDLGVQVAITPGNFDFHIAFFKNDEGSYGGSSRDSARYSFDFVKASATELGEDDPAMMYDHQETNQVNARVAYRFIHAKVGSTEIGASGQYGGMYNGETNKLGYHWATAGHIVGNYTGFEVQLEAIMYEYHPAFSAGQTDSFVVMGAHDDPLKVACKGYLLVGNIAYKLKLDLKYLSSITFYNDFSSLFKRRDDFEDSYQIMPGIMIATGPVITQIELGIAQNHPWIGPHYVNSLAQGGAGNKWAYRPNINISYYF